MRNRSTVQIRVQELRTTDRRVVVDKPLGIDRNLNATARFATNTLEQLNRQRNIERR